MPRSSGFLRGFTTNALCTALTFGLGTLNQALIAHHLGKEGRGDLALIATTVVLAAMAIGEWMSRGNTYITSKEQDRLAATVGNTTVYCLGASAMLLGVASFAGDGVARDYFGHVTPYLVAGLIAVTISQKAVHAILLGQDRMAYYAAVPTVFIAVYLAGTAAVLSLTDWGLAGVLAAWFAGTVVSLALAAVPYLVHLRPRLDRQVLRRTAAVGKRGAVSVTLIFAMFRCDVYLVEHLLDIEQVGVYAIAIVIAEMMQRLPNVAGVVLLPKVIGGRDGADKLSAIVARNVLLLSLVLALGIWLVGELFIQLLFPKFVDAYEPLLWMLPGLVASGFGSVLNTRLAGQGYPAITLWAPGVALAAKITLSLAFIPDLGLNGAALSTSCAYTLWTLIVALRYSRLTATGWRDFLRGQSTGG